MGERTAEKDASTDEEKYENWIIWMGIPSNTWIT